MTSSFSSGNLRLHSWFNYVSSSLVCVTNDLYKRRSTQCQYAMIFPTIGSHVSTHYFGFVCVLIQKSLVDLTSNLFIDFHWLCELFDLFFFVFLCGISVGKTLLSLFTRSSLLYDYILINPAEGAVGHFWII